MLLLTIKALPFVPALRWQCTNRTTTENCSFQCMHKQQEGKVRCHHDKFHTCACNDADADRHPEGRHPSYTQKYRNIQQTAKQTEKNTFVMVGSAWMEPIAVSGELTSLCCMSSDEKRSGTSSLATLSADGATELPDVKPAYWHINKQLHHCIGIITLSLTNERLRERTEHRNIFFAHHSMVFYFRCSVDWWKGSVRF